MNYVDESRMNGMNRNKNSNTLDIIDDSKNEQVIEVQDTPTPSPKSPTAFKSPAQKVSECLYGDEVVDLDKLRKLSWNGIPCEFRGLCWKLLMVNIIIHIFLTIPLHYSSYLKR